MNIWIVCVGEPLPIDSDNVRLRRMGSLAKYISENEQDSVEWFSASFDHYQKKQRVNKSKRLKISDKYFLNVAYANGYKKNVSVSRIIHHKVTARNIYGMMIKQEKPDIIIASMEPLEVSEAAIKYGQRYDVPVVLDVRDLWPEIFFEVLPKKIAPIITPYVSLCRNRLSKTMKSAYSIVGLSEYFLQYGLKFARREKKETDRVFPIAYPNYDYDAYKSEFENIWSKYNLHENDFIITFMGNFGKQFEFDEIIKASKSLHKYNNIKFVLCGLGEQLDSIKSQVGDNVIFPGWIEKTAIGSLLSNTDIGIAPYINSVNYRNNTPNKFGEYLSASLPILVSVTGEMESLLYKNNCGYSYSNSEDLIQKILVYYNDAKILSESKKNARLLYDSMFNSDSAYEKMTNYLKELVKYSKDI